MSGSYFFMAWSVVGGWVGGPSEGRPCAGLLGLGSGSYHASKPWGHDIGTVQVLLGQVPCWALPSCVLLCRDARQGSDGSKWSISALAQWMRQQGHDWDGVWGVIKHMIAKTLLAIQPIL